MLIENKKTFGLDISGRTVRLVALRRKGKKIIMTSRNEITLPLGVIENGEIKNINLFSDNIKKLIKNVKGENITTKSVISVLPETKTFIKVITISKQNEPITKKTVEQEAKNHIPLNLEESYLDWQVINSKKSEILIAAVPKQTSDSYYSALEKSGLLPQCLEVEAAAISRSIISNEQSKDFGEIIIDFGAARTGLIVHDKNTIQFTVSLPISGDEITNTISKKLKIDPQKAEESKIICGLDPKKCEGALLKILQKPIDDLAKQIKQAILYYKTVSPDREIKKIILCGGGANFSGIDLVLKEKLALEVTISNPLEKIIVPKKLALSKQKSLSYATAVGLALRPHLIKIL